MKLARQINTVADMLEAEGRGSAAMMMREIGEQVEGLVAALELALLYIYKGNEQGAYDGCGISGQAAARRIEAAIAKAKGA